MKKQINQKTLLPMLAALLCIILLIASIFLPYFTAMDEYKELLEATKQEFEISLYDISQIYLDEGIDALFSIVCAYVVCNLMAAVFAICRKPVLVLIFDILNAAQMTLTYIIFTTDSMPFYNLGISSTLIFAGCAGLFVSAIWMMIAKACAKKKNPEAE